MAEDDLALVFEPSVRFETRDGGLFDADLQLARVPGSSEQDAPDQSLREACSAGNVSAGSTDGPDDGADRDAAAVARASRFPDPPGQAEDNLERQEPQAGSDERQEHGRLDQKPPLAGGERQKASKHSHDLRCRLQDETGAPARDGGAANMAARRIIGRPSSLSDLSATQDVVSFADLSPRDGESHVQLSSGRPRDRVFAAAVGG
jgi:hypothetical protein